MKLRFFPLGIGAAMLAVGSLLLLVNLVVIAVVHSPIKLFPGLTGMVVSPHIPTTMTAILDGSAQAAYGRLVGSEIPLYPAAVRLRNQVEYSVFGYSANPVVMVGRKGVLIERVYAEEYCARDIATWQPGARRWAQQIRDMQDAQARRGKAFLYVLTPSKVAQYPGWLPLGFNCPSGVADRVGLVPAWLDMLRMAGVHVVDTTAVLSAARSAYPFPLYPAGGTHWNAVGEAIAQQAVLRGLNVILPDRGFESSPFTWTIRPHPVRDSDDVDLARLLNLFVPAANGPVPAVDPHPAAAPASCAPPRVVIIGGSFSHATLKALSGMPCPVAATEYEYWRAATLRWGSGELDKQFSVDPARRDADLLMADVLIYEENEQILRQPFHGKALAQFLQEQAGG